MGHAPSVERVFFPLDRELGLLPGALAPRQQEHLVHLASFMPFEHVAQMMKELLAVHISSENVRRLTERLGACMEEAEIHAEGDAQKEPPLQRCALSADGAMVSLVHKQWVEVRTVAIGEPVELVNAKGEREIHVGKLSYFSRLADALTFTKLSQREMQRRQVSQAQEVCAVMDGADWLQFFTEMHRPDARRILDFPHAAEHVSKLIEAFGHMGLPFPPRLLERCLHILKHRGSHALLCIAERLRSALPQEKGIGEHLDYLRKRETLMQYPLFHQEGWPIGSGMVESANKNTVQARLKGAGMHWERSHVNPMLALRNAVCNDRWHEMWHKALQRARKRQALCTRKSLRRPSPPLSLTLSSSDEKKQELSLPDSSPSQKAAEQKKSICLCGTPLVSMKRGRRKKYCSGRCRQEAHRRRQALLPPLTLPLTFRPFPHRLRLGGTLCETKMVKGKICLCGVPLIHLQGKGRRKEYCSDRCRQHAFRLRQRWGG